MWTQNKIDSKHLFKINRITRINSSIISSRHDHNQLCKNVSCNLTLILYNIQWGTGRSEDSLEYRTSTLYYIVFLRLFDFATL